MAKLSLKALLSASSGSGAPVAELLAALEGPLSIEDCSGKVLMGSPSPGAARVPVVYADAALGCVSGPQASAEAVVSLLTHMAARETERRALAGEVLHLYREIHLIDQLSEDLTALLDVSAVCRSALAQARRLIAASSGGVLVHEKADAPMHYVAVFGEESTLPEAGGRLAAAILDRGVPEIVNVAEMFSAGPEVAAVAPAFRSVIFAPLRAKQRNLGLIVLANEAGTPYAAADLKLLNTIALQTAAAIENSVLCAQMVDAARYREQLTAMEREMDTARAIQHSLLPRTFPPFPDRTDFEIHAQMTSARAVGGDFFDFFLIDDDHLGLVIGDVSGKGTPAALYMAMTHTHVKTVALRGMAPEDCMGEVNRILRSDNASSMFATCFYGILNTRTGNLRYSNAGHNQPYHIGSDGVITPLEARGGTPLGLFPWKKYDGATTQLGPGDGLFLFTDGVSEAENPQHDDFTNERLVEVLCSSASRPSREVVEMMHARLIDFTAGAPQSDDITMLSVRRTGLPRAM